MPQQHRLHSCRSVQNFAVIALVQFDLQQYKNHQASMSELISP